MKLKALLLASMLVFSTQNIALVFAEEKVVSADKQTVEKVEEKTVVPTQADAKEMAPPVITKPSELKPEVKIETPTTSSQTEATNQPEKSEVDLIAETKKAPSLNAYYDLGRYYFQQRQYDKAELAFTKAQDLGRKWPTDPAYIDTVYYLGDVYYNTGRYADSEKKYRQVLTLGLNDDELHSYLGDALRKQAKYNPAKDEYEKALQLNADNSIAKDGIDEICKVTKCNK